MISDQQQNQNNRELGLPGRIQRKVLQRTILGFLIILILMVVFTLTLLKVKNNSEKTIIYNLEKQTINIQQENIQEKLISICSDLFQLADNRYLKAYWLEQEQEFKENMRLDFIELATHRRMYDQIRLIDIDGNELIRINFNNGTPEPVPDSLLQNKYGRYYFSESVKLSENEFYISPLDLNIENGEIEEPIKPMLRICTPVFDANGTKRGVVVLNYFAGLIIKNIAKHENPLIKNDLYLINSDGYYLKGPDKESEWAFMYAHKKDISFRNRYMQAWAQIQDTNNIQFENKNGLFTLKNIYPLSLFDSSVLVKTDNSPLQHVTYHPDSYYWKLISFIPRSELKAHNLNRTLLTALVIVVFGIGLLILSLRFYKWSCQAKYAELAINESNERFKTTMNSIDAAVYVADMETCEVLFANKYLTDMLGDVVGKTCYKSLQINQDTPCSFCTNKLLVDKNNKPNQPHIWEFQNTKTNRWYQIHDQAIKWVNGKLVRMEVAFDITDRKEMEQALSSSEQRLKIMNANKDKFFSIISHDLRAPLGSLCMLIASITSSINKLEKERIASMLHQLHNSSERLYNLLENLLEWSKLQGKAIQAIPEELNMQQQISNSINILSDNIIAKELNIIFDNAASHTVYADKNMTATVLRNLISNAIKFTPKNGSIEICCKEIQNNQNRRMIETTISDSGVGMNEKKVKSLFKIEYNESTKGTEGEDGSGLGLILCQELIAKNTGEIRVESTPEKGSVFLFTLPAEAI